MQANFDTMKVTKPIQSIFGIGTLKAKFGAACALMAWQVSTKGGLVQRKNVVRYSTEWIEEAPNAAPEERATVADFRLLLGDQNVTTHLVGERASDHVTISLHPIAHGLTHDWWTLFGGRDSFVSLIKHRSGYVVPDVRLSFDGAVFEVRAEQKVYANPGIRFWAGSPEIMSRADAESILSRLIEQTLERLNIKDVRHTSAALRWARIKESRLDPEQTAFCEAAGAMGLDPYDISDAHADTIEASSKLFSGEALIEFLAAAPASDAGRLLNWIDQEEKKPRHLSRLAELQEVARSVEKSTPTRTGEQSWALGYRRARGLRRHLDLPQSHRFDGYRGIAMPLGASDSFQPSRQVPGISVLRTEYEDGTRLYLRERTGPFAETGYKFAIARGVGDAVCFPDTPRSAVNDLHFAERQAAGRAFAAEFLAPSKEVQSMLADGNDIDSIADEFGVSPGLILHQVENQRRIAQACAA